MGLFCHLSAFKSFNPASQKKCATLNLAGQKKLFKQDLICFLFLVTKRTLYSGAAPGRIPETQCLKMLAGRRRRCTTKSLFSARWPVELKLRDYFIQCISCGCRLHNRGQVVCLPETRLVCALCLQRARSFHATVEASRPVPSRLSFHPLL